MKTFLYYIVLLFAFSAYAQPDFFYEVGPYLGTGEKYYTGKVQTLAVSPTNESILYAGSPSGGLWKSTNAGDSWTLLNDDLPLVGVSSIQISETDEDILYISSGDKFHQDQLSEGVFKSTNGGLSWQNTVWSNTTETTDIALSKVNQNLLFVSSVNGLEKSLDGGITASTVIANDTIYNVKIHPTNENLVFASSATTLYRSTDGGNTFQANVNFNANYNLKKITFDVSQVNPNEVAIAGASTNNHLDYVFKSNDFGVTFQEIANTFGGQGYTEKIDGLAIQFDNVDSSAIYIGKLNCWKAEEVIADMYSFDQKSQWFVDRTDSSFLPHYINDLLVTNQYVYAASHGGVYRFDKVKQFWENRNNQLHVYQSLNFDIGPQTIVSSSATVPAFVDFGLAQYAFYQGVDGVLKEVNGFPHVISVSENGKLRAVNLGLQAPIISIEIPTTNAQGCLLNRIIEPDAFYIGLNQIYKFDIISNSYNALTNLSNKNVRQVKSNFSNTDLFYFSTDSLLYFTDNNFNSIQTIALPYATKIKSFDVFNLNNNTIILALENGANDEVFISDDLGITWNNISNGILENRITTVFADDFNSRIFVGTSKSLYEKPLDNSTSFSSFNQNLPKTAITEINITDNNQVWVSTFGRGIWTTDYNYSNINEQQTMDLRLYPNPSEGFLYLDNFSSVEKLVVYNSLGELVLEENNPTQTIDIRKLKNGIYFVKCISVLGVMQKKVIKF